MNPENWIGICSRRTTEDLFAAIKRLDFRKTGATNAVLAHLAELDKREAAVAKGFPSLFVYCTQELGYSEAEAFVMIRAARAARRFPRILTMLARRQIHLSAVSKLFPHLRSDNYVSLLDRASRRTLEELDRLLAELAPMPEKRPVIRTLSVSSGPFGTNGVRLDPEMAPGGQAAGTAAFDLPEVAASAPAAPSAAGPATQPAATGRVLFNFVGPERLRQKFSRAKEVMRHKYPWGLPEQIFEDALDALLDRKDPERKIARIQARRDRAAVAGGSWFPLPEAEAAARRVGVQRPFKT